MKKTMVGVSFDGLSDMHKRKFYILGKGNIGRSFRVSETASAYGGRKGHKLLSLFSGAMGLDLGLEAAGFQTAGCLEIDKWASKTIRENRKDLPLITDDIRNWNSDKLLDFCRIRKEEVAVIAGGPPCPSFSTAGRRQSFNDPRGQVMFDFLRIVEEIMPPFFVMENVRGILSASITHRPIALRNVKNGGLTPDEQHGSVLRLLRDRFKKMGYTVTAELVNAADYGVPQNRERVVFLGSRDGFQVTMPPGEYARSGSLFQRPWRTLRDAIGDLKDEEHEFMPFSKERLKYLKLLREGENWRNLPKHLVPAAMGGAFDSDGGRVGFYRRLSFDKPSPTVPTSPVQKSTCLCHPTELRSLSVREYARIQQFPDDWVFLGSVAEKYRQIGNAVPVGLGYHIGKAVLRFLDNYEEL